jgi:hypothetical protein
VIDTLQIKHIYKSLFSEERLRSIGAIQPSGYRKNKTWVLNPKGHRSEFKPRIAFIFTPDLAMHVEVTASLPKLLFGHNAKLPTETECWDALEIIEEFVVNTTGLMFTTRDATISEVHFARDFEFGDVTAKLVTDQLKRRIVPRFGMRQFQETLYFENQSKNRLIRVYPKLPEVLRQVSPSQEAIDQAREKLRIEFVALRRAVKQIAKGHGIESPTAENIVREKLSGSVMDQVLHDLDFTSCSFEGPSNIELMLAKYSRKQACSLSGFVSMIEHYGPNFYRDPKWGLTKQQYQYYLRLVRKAGAWPKVS